MELINNKYWYKVQEQRPPQGVVVETIISDAGGVRNEAKLKLNGNLWFMADGKMYVYYTPTHLANYLIKNSFHDTQKNLNRR